MATLASEDVGAIIAAIGTPEFPTRLIAALRAMTAFDYAVMFAYRGDQRPIDLYDDFPASKRRIFVTTYQEGPYLLDPFFLAGARRIEPGLYRLRDLAPDRFYQSEYFRSYYVQTGLTEEIGYFIPLAGDLTAVISLMRAVQSPAFSTREFRDLAGVKPVVRAAAARHWADLHRRHSPAGDTDGEQSSVQRHIEHAYRTFGRTVLTPREREVVEFVLKGHSSDAIGKILDISPGTVRIHRKNIYSKLGINSQGDLFSLFIRALSSEADTASM
jgi:DNA-binding CsgD family transcriptional regulator